MATSLDIILVALQNGVNAINSLNATLRSVFPNTTASSSVVVVGTLTFSSSQPNGFLVVQTSSGATVAVPFYPLT